MKVANSVEGSPSRRPGRPHTGRSVGNVTDQTYSGMPPALRRALDLIADPPAEPDTGNGFLDLLANSGAAGGAATNTGAIQALWASAIGSNIYDNAQLLARRLLAAWRSPIDWLAIPPGGTALDVGCGPGNVTAALARAAGPDGLALGVDISAAMLERAVAAAAGPQVGFIRADAQRLPFRDDTVDAVTSIAALQLIPDPTAALAEMARVLRPGGKLAIMVPTAGPAVRLLGRLPVGGARGFAEDELGDIVDTLGFTGVRTKLTGTVQWVRATR